MTGPFDATLEQLVEAFEAEHVSGVVGPELRFVIGVQWLKESSTLQAILAEGLAEGLVRAHQEDLIALLQERFGAVPPDVEARIRGATDPARLQAALRAVLRIASPAELPL